MNSTTSVPRRIGLLGGTFDPIHAGHLQLARDAMRALALDQVLFVVAAAPWQKSGVTAAADRLRMVQIALCDTPNFAAEDCELRRTGPTYTIDTLIELRERWGRDACLVLLMGSDQWLRLHTWHRHAELADYANMAVAHRGESPDRAVDRLPRLGAICRAAGQTVSFPMTTHPASATAIRAALAAHQPCDDLLPPGVLAYIREHHLYEPIP